MDLNEYNKEITVNNVDPMDPLQSSEEVESENNSESSIVSEESGKSEQETRKTLIKKRGMISEAVNKNISKFYLNLND